VKIYIPAVATQFLETRGDEEDHSDQTPTMVLKR
jgi:hypothetical protein